MSATTLGSPANRAAQQWVVVGQGFVGSALSDYLQSVGVPVRTCPAPRLTASPTDDPRSLVLEALQHPAVDLLAEQLANASCVILAAGMAWPDAKPSRALFGANALLPGVVTVAAQRRSVARLIHLSSAAVQGRATALTETPTTMPFSAYSRSKAMGEAVFSQLAAHPLNSVMVRATSVQGRHRGTTVNLRRAARSWAASVAQPGDQPSAVSSIGTLCQFVHHVGSWPKPVPLVVLQPWEGLSVTDVLTISADRSPRRLPRRLCRGAVSLGYRASSLVGHALDGPVRRVEAMWFGQAVEAGWAHRTGFRSDPAEIAETLRGGARAHQGADILGHLAR